MWATMGGRLSLRRAVTRSISLEVYVVRAREVKQYSGVEPAVVIVKAREVARNTAEWSQLETSMRLCSGWRTGPTTIQRGLGGSVKSGYGISSIRCKASMGTGVVMCAAGEEMRIRVLSICTSLADPMMMHGRRIRHQHPNERPQVGCKAVGWDNSTTSSMARNAGR